MNTDRNKIKIRVCIALAVALFAFFFAIIFFKFYDNTYEGFVFKKENGYAVVMGYTGHASKLEIPSTHEGLEVRYISESAFGGADSPIKEITIPSTVKEIGKDAFAGSPVLKTVKLSEGLEVIGEGAFSNCPSLKNIKLPKTLLKIDDKAFYACIRLKKLKVPSSVDYIGTYAFASCERLLLDVSENSIAADVAEQYKIETGKVDKTNVYLVIIALTSGAMLLAIWFVARAVKKKRASQAASKTE